MSEKKRRATAAEIRDRAFGDVIEWLEYRVAVCRDGLERHTAAHGADSRAVAMERAAAFEAELILREIGKLLGIPIIDHVVIGERSFRSIVEWAGTGL